MVYVLEDREYEKAKKGFKERTLSFVKIEENQNYNQLISEIEKSAAKVKIYTYINQHTWDYYAAEIFCFLGMVMSVIFMLSMFSTIYFKILKDAFMDREQYVILKKLGMSRNQIKKFMYIRWGEERNVKNIVDETRTALKKAKIDGPYVLMGHSISGVYAEYYAAAYPREDENCFSQSDKKIWLK